MTVILQRNGTQERFEVYDVKSITDAYVIIANDRYSCLKCTFYDGSQYRYLAKDYTIEEVVW